MKPLDDALLAEYALGTLPAADRAAVEAELARSPSARAAVDEVRAVLGRLGEALPPESPPTGGRDRLLAAAAPLRSRFEALAERLAALIDVGVEQARALLAGVDEAWAPSPWTGVTLFHLPRGPRIAAAHDAGLVRVQAGTRFPYHEHVGAEEVLVLQGAFVDHADGAVYRAGDHVRQAAGSRHAYTALDGPDLVYAVVLFGPIEFP